MAYMVGDHVFAPSNAGGSAGAGSLRPGKIIFIHPESEIVPLYCVRFTSHLASSYYESELEPQLDSQYTLIV